MHKANMKQKVIYPGTFDPVTNGHLDILKRALRIFPEVVIAVANVQTKTPYFDLRTRLRLLSEVVQSMPGVSVLGFDGLLVDFMRAQQATIVLRGLRGAADLEFESQLAGMNRTLCPEIETVFLIPSAQVSCISSSLVREIAALGGDVSSFIPAPVANAFKAKAQ
jgi:pantetheine-phosphate adenylyltransferase